MFPLLRVIVWQLRHWDEALSYLLFLQPRADHAAPWLAEFRRAVQIAARNEEWLWFVASILLYAGARGNNPRRARRVAAWCVTLALSSLVVILLKQVVRRPHPDWRPATLSSHAIDLGEQFGFPSGYAARLAATSFWLSRIFGKRAMVLWIAAPLLLLSRVRLGADYVNDVLGGAAVGGVLAAVVERVARGRLA